MAMMKFAHLPHQQFVYNTMMQMNNDVCCMARSLRGLLEEWGEDEGYISRIDAIVKARRWAKV